VSTTTIIDGTAEEVPQPPPMMPPDVMAGVARCQALASDTELMRVTRRNPETGEWWCVTERTGGGYVVYEVPADRPHTQHSVWQTLSQAERVVDNLAEGRPAEDMGSLPPPPAPPAEVFADDPVARLAWVKERAKAKVDRDAETARSKYITPGAGQAMEYLATEAEADQVLATPDSMVLPAGMFRFLDAEVAARGGTLREAAIRVMQAAAQWRQVGGAIKALRLATKDQIEAAPTEDAVWALAVVNWPLGLPHRGRWGR